MQLLENPSHFILESRTVKSSKEVYFSILPDVVICSFNNENIRLFLECVLGSSLMVD